MKVPPLFAQQKLDNDTTGELTMDGAMDEVVADACEMMLRDSEAVQRLAKENRSLAEKIRDWIGDFVEKVRAAFAGDRATHAEARAMLDRMDALQRLWDDALVDAAEANAAKENTAGDGGMQEQARGKYWRPKLNSDEWNLLNRRMETGLDSEKQYLDESTKWLYAEENGVRVFALYGVGDGAEATPLYAVGGKQAATDYTAVTEYIERRKKYDGDGRSVDTWAELFRRKKRSWSGNLSQAKGTATATGTVHGLYGGSSRGNAGRAAERGAQNQRGVKGKFSLREPGDEMHDGVIAQEITSDKTSIKQVAGLFKDKNAKFGKTNIDVGGGRFNLVTEYLAERGTENMVFDPYNRGIDENTETLRYLQSGNHADTATCANVLNVIREADARANVILEVAKCIGDNGTAYFTVYEGDGSGIGKRTSAGWQTNRKTPDYIDEISRYFDHVQRKGKLIIATQPKSNLPKASWEVEPGRGVKFSERDKTRTERDILADATDGDANTVREMEMLREYKEMLGRYTALTQQPYPHSEKCPGS